jgi:hypothetical protein
MRRVIASSVALLTLVILGGSDAGQKASAARDTTANFTFRGNGGKTLPPFRVSVPSTMFWASGGAIFQTFGQGLGGGNVNSQASKGATYLAPGRYVIQVNADGNWVIQVVPGVERPKRLSGSYVGFKGNGGRDLPPLRLPRSEQVYWAGSGAIFQIFDKNYSGGVEVNSQAHKGSTYASRGTHHLTVNADGNWVIAWRP